MIAIKREILRSDVLPAAEYGKLRREHRRRVAELKRNRRLEVGPFATFYFESYETMWHQVHEMLFIEKGGEEQIPGELAAYNPLIPRGSELVATVMFEIEDPARRARELAKLGGVEHRMSIEILGETIPGRAADDHDRTSAAGKASSVQFVRFAFSPAQIAAFRAPGARVVVAIDHPAYAHMAVVPEEVRQALARDFA